MNKRERAYFSEHEKDLLRILDRKKMTIAQISEEFFKEETLETNNYVASIVRRITRKCEHYKLPWTLVGKGAGRHGKTVWRIKRSAEQVQAQKSL